MSPVYTECLAVGMFRHDSLSGSDRFKEDARVVRGRLPEAPYPRNGGDQLISARLREETD